MLGQLAECPSISEYHITLLLASVCAHDPEAITDLLIQRIEIWEEASSPLDRDPLPHKWHQVPPFATHPQYGDLLRKVLRWMTDGMDSWRRQSAGSELFALMAGDFGPEVLSVLQEALVSGETPQVRAVGSILGHAPRALLWDQVDFVCLAIRTADQHGEEVLQHVAGRLHTAAFTETRFSFGGIRFGTPQQPFGEDINQRDRAAEIVAQLPLGSIEQEFYQSLIESAQRGIQWKTEIDDRLTSRRQW